MLETHDPDWSAKWDRCHSEMLALEARPWGSLSAEEEERLADLRRALPLIFDAKHRTPNEYIALHLSFVLQEAEKLGLAVNMPWLPDDAGILAARAAVAEVAALVEAEKRWREQTALAIKLTADGWAQPRDGRPWGFRLPQSRRARLILVLHALRLRFPLFRVLLPRLPSVAAQELPSPPTPSRMPFVPAKPARLPDE